MHMFKRTMVPAILFAMSAIGFVLRERLEMPEQAGLNRQNGLELLYQSSLLVRGLAIASAVLLAAAPSFLGSGFVHTTKEVDSGVKWLSVSQRGSGDVHNFP